MKPTLPLIAAPDPHYTYVAYRDLPDYGVSGFQLCEELTQDALSLVRPGEYAALPGKRALHITHLEVGSFYIICYTHEALSPARMEEIKSETFAFLAPKGEQ